MTAPADTRTVPAQHLPAEGVRRPAGDTAAARPAGGPPAGGSRPLAVATVAAPVVLAAGVTLHPDDTHGVERTLTAIAGDEKLAWTLTHLVEPAAWALLGTCLLLVLPRLAGARGGTLLKVAAVFCGIGFSALGMLVYGHGEAYLMMANSGVEPSVYAPLFEQFEKAMPLAALPSLLGRVGLVLAFAGLLRARTVPVWAAVLLVLPGLLLGTGGLLPMAVGLAVFFGPLIVGLAACARVVARTGGPALGARC